MRRIVLSLFLTAAFTLTAQQNLSKEKKIERILQITNSDAVVSLIAKQIEDTLAPLATTPQQKTRAKEAVDKIIKLVRSRVEKIRPQMVKAYSDTFTPEEIDAMLAFYETPAGKASVEKLPLINTKMSSLIQAEITSLTPEINKIAEDALKK